jgi:hypothetical protein
MSALGEMTAQPRLARELLRFFGELTELHAGSAFVMQALASALVHGEGRDDPSATGAVFCVRWLEDRVTERERQLKDILSITRVPTT